MSLSEDTFERLFHECLELPAEEREAYIQNKGVDDALAERLRRRVGLHRTQAEKQPDDSPPEDDTPTAIPGYKLIEKIGSGGFGDVYVARETSDAQRRVAVKILKTNANKIAVERFRREQRFLGTFTHPYICRLYASGTTDHGHRYMVMELVDGGSMIEYCQKHDLPLQRRLQLFQRLCEAVEHVHKEGLLHRDLKPSNVLVKASGDGIGEPRLLDFGIAREMRSKVPDATITRESGSPGTPGFMSPQQALSDPHDLDVRDDVYSLGKMLERLIDGCPEAGACTIRKTIDQAVSDRRADRHGSVMELRTQLDDTQAVVDTARDRDKRRVSKGNEIAIYIVVVLVLGFGSVLLNQCTNWLD